MTHMETKHEAIDVACANCGDIFLVDASIPYDRIPLYCDRIACSEAAYLDTLHPAEYEEDSGDYQ